MAIVKVKKAVWNVKTASVGGAWNLDALGGLLRGVIYLTDQFDPLLLTGSKGSTASGTKVGDVEVKAAGVAGGLFVYEVVSTADVTGEGLLQIDAEFDEDDGKGEGSDTYTKAEVDAKVNAKENKGVAYTKAEADAKVATKEDKGVAYPKADVDTKLAGKAAVGASYTKAEADARFEPKASA